MNNDEAEVAAAAIAGELGLECSINESMPEGIAGVVWFGHRKARWSVATHGIENVTAAIRAALSKCNSTIRASDVSGDPDADGKWWVG